MANLWAKLLLNQQIIMVPHMIISDLSISLVECLEKNFFWKNTELIECPVLAIDNGIVTVVPNDRTLNSTATYSCTVGYSLQGNSERFCQRDGTWSGTSDPECGKQRMHMTSTVWMWLSTSVTHLMSASYVTITQSSSSVLYLILAMVQWW